MSAGTGVVSSTASGLAREMAAILLTAVALGVVYNHASPLGIRRPGPDAPRSHRETVTPWSAMPETESDPTISNETIQALMVPGAAVDFRPDLKSLPQAMTWDEVEPLLAGGSIILIDSRDAEAYALGHIPGAVSLPMDQLAGKIGQFTDRYPEDTPLVLYCASIRCQTANAQALVLMREHGYKDVREMPGGFAEWRISEPQAEPAVGSAP